jgi:hypothetical protein
MILGVVRNWTLSGGGIQLWAENQRGSAGRPQLVFVFTSAIHGPIVTAFMI